MMADESLTLAAKTAPEAVKLLKRELTKLRLGGGNAKRVAKAIVEAGLIEHKRVVVGHRYPELPPGYIGYMVPIPVYGKMFVFDIKKTMIFLYASAIGALVAGPAGSAASALIKYLATKPFAIVEVQSGAACNYATMYAAAARLSAQQVLESTASKRCCREALDCSHRDGKACSITAEAVTENVTRLEERGAVVGDGGLFRAVF